MIVETALACLQASICGQHDDHGRQQFNESQGVVVVSCALHVSSQIRPEDFRSPVENSNVRTAETA